MKEEISTPVVYGKHTSYPEEGLCPGCKRRKVMEPHSVLTSAMVWACLARLSLQLSSSSFFGHGLSEPWRISCFSVLAWVRRWGRS